MLKTLLPVTLLIFCLAGCRRHDIRTTVIAVPDMKNAACAQVIQNAFMSQPGILTIRPDLKQHALEITYDSMVIARKNLEFTIASAGFRANDIPAFSNAVAGLPPECKE